MGNLINLEYQFALRKIANAAVRKEKAAKAKQRKRIDILMAYARLCAMSKGEADDRVDSN